MVDKVTAVQLCRIIKIQPEFDHDKEDYSFAEQLSWQTKPFNTSLFTVDAIAIAILKSTSVS